MPWYQDGMSPGFGNSCPRIKAVGVGRRNNSSTFRETRMSVSSKHTLEYSVSCHAQSLLKTRANRGFAPWTNTAGTWKSRMHRIFQKNFRSEDIAFDHTSAVTNRILSMCLLCSLREKPRTRAFRKCSSFVPQRHETKAQGDVEDSIFALDLHLSRKKYKEEWNHVPKQLTCIYRVAWHWLKYVFMRIDGMTQQPKLECDRNIKNHIYCRVSKAHRILHEIKSVNNGARDLVKCNNRVTWNVTKRYVKDNLFCVSLCTSQQQHRFIGILSRHSCNKL